MSSRPRQLWAVLCLAGAFLCAYAFHLASAEYDGFAQPQAGLYHVPVAELAFDVWYVVYGLAFVALSTMGLLALGVGPLLRRLARAIGASRSSPALLAVLVGALSLGFRAEVLERQVITDDEEVYRFIAQTLLEGRVANPAPEDALFYRNQYVVMTPQRWFGKYPIGHPLLLALGMKVGMLDLVGPLLGGLTTWLTWELGRRLLGRTRAAWATGLLALSPHFVWTHATLLSQPTACLFLMLGLLALARVRTTATPVGWVALAGAALALSVLARPLPGVLFVALAAVPVFERARLGGGLDRLKLAAAFVAPLGAVAGLFAVVHQAQSGSALSSGYHQAQGDELGLFVTDLGLVSLSVFSATLRENFWLLGWPLSLLPLAFARPRRGRFLLWLPVVAELVYRVVSPKTVVSTTGPTYLLESVPVLCLLCADGVARAALWARRRQLGAGLVPATVASAIGAALVFFVPIEVRAVSTAAQARLVLPALVEELALQKALIFTGPVVPPTSHLTWAYFPPSPAPRLDEAVLFVRWPGEPDAEARAVDFWRRHYPDRPAFVLQLEPEPKLVALTAPP